MLKKTFYLLLTVIFFTLANAYAFESDQAPYKKGILFVYFKNNVSFQQAKNFAAKNNCPILGISAPVNTWPKMLYLTVEGPELVNNPKSFFPVTLKVFNEIKKSNLVSDVILDKSLFYEESICTRGNNIYVLFKDNVSFNKAISFFEELNKTYKDIYFWPGHPGMDFFEKGPTERGLILLTPKGEEKNLIKYFEKQSIVSKAELYYLFGFGSAGAKKINNKNIAPYVEGELIVTFPEGTSTTQINKIMAEYKCSIIQHINGMDMVIIKVTPGKEDAVESILEKDKRIQSCSKNYLMTIDD